MLPQYVVLGTREMFALFRSSILPILFFQGDDNVDAFYWFIFSSIFAYIGEYDNAKSCLHEFIDNQTADLGSEITDPKELMQVSVAIQVLGKSLISECYRLGIYDTQGVLWYEFSKFLNDDVVLTRIKEEDLIN